MMQRLFGKKKPADAKPQKVDLPSAIMQNKDAIQVLDKRQAHLEKRIATLDGQVRELVANSSKDKTAKTRAVALLKSKTMLANQLTQLCDARLTLEQQIIQLESAQAQRLAVGALAAGVDAQKALGAQLNVNRIDKLMEDMHEQQDLQNDLAQVLSGGGPILDETDLLAELGQIEAEELDKKLADAQSVPTELPSLPAKPVEIKQQPAQEPISAATSAPVLSDEEQLRLLQANLA